MNRTLRRPMFRIGGSVGEGITSGLAPRQGYKNANRVYEWDELNPEKNKQRLIELGIWPHLAESGATVRNNKVIPKNEQAIVPGNTGSNFVGGGTGTNTQSIIDKAKAHQSILDAVYPRQKTDSMAGANFLMNWGVDLASRPRSGNIFQQAATSARDPLLRFQEEKLMEQATAAKETSEDRALLAKMLEGMDDDKLSALMKDVKAGVDAGEFPDEATGIKLLLRKKIYGVLDAPGEADQRRINELEKYVINNDDKSFGYARQVAEHMHKMQTGAYPKEVAEELNQTVVYIKPRHKARDIKPEYDDQGQITKFTVQGKFARTYRPGIYFDPDTGNLFKRVSSTGQAPVFQRVDFD